MPTWREALKEVTSHGDRGDGESVLRDLTIIVVMGVLVRAALFLVFDFAGDFRSGDSAYYLAVGRNIVEHGIHGETADPSAYRAPLYSLLAGVVAAGFDAALFFFIVQGALFIGFAIAVYFILGGGASRLAFLSALFIAASPFDALCNGRVMSENLVTPLLVLGTLVFAFSRGAGGYLLAGLLLALAALTREIYVLLPVLFVAAGLWTGTPRRNLLIFFFAFALATLPWAYRNSQLPSGGLHLSGGGLWTNLWIGTWERDTGWTARPNDLPAEAVRTLGDASSPSALSAAWRNGDQAYFKDVTLRYVRADPLEVLQTWIARYPRMWFGTRSDLFSTFASRESGAWFVVKASFFLLSATIVVLSALGAAAALRTGQLPPALLLPVAYNALIYIPFHNAETRYSQPVFPILEIYCACFLLRAWISPPPLRR